MPLLPKHWTYKGYFISQERIQNLLRQPSYHRAVEPEGSLTCDMGPGGCDFTYYEKVINESDITKPENRKYVGKVGTFGVLKHHDDVIFKLGENEINRLLGEYEL